MRVTGTRVAYIVEQLTNVTVSVSDMFQVVPRESIRCSVVRNYGGNDF